MTDKSLFSSRAQRLGAALGAAAVTAVWITGGLILNTWWAQLWPMFVLFGAVAAYGLWGIVRWVWHG